MAFEISGDVIIIQERVVDVKKKNDFGHAVSEMQRNCTGIG
jgi:hypothetical protein